MVILLSVTGLCVSGCDEGGGRALSRAGCPEVSKAPKGGPANVRRLSPQDPEKVIETLKDRLARLRNIIVDHEVKTTYPPLRPGEVATTRPKGARFTITRVTGMRVWKKRFMLLEGKSRYETRITIIEGAAQGADWRPETEAQIRTYYEEGAEYLGLDQEGKPLRAVLYGPRRLPPPEIEIGLALRSHGQTDRLHPQALEGMRLHLPDNHTAILRANDNEQYTHEWTFDRRHGYALARYQRIPPPGRMTHHEVVMGDFRDAAGMILPYSMVLTSKTVRAGGFRTNLTSEVSVKSYRLNDPENTPSRYHIDFPNGTRIRDRREPATRPPATRPTTAPAAG